MRTKDAGFVWSLFVVTCEWLMVGKIRVCASWS